MFDKNDPFYKENIIPYLETGWDETDIEYFVNTLNELHKNFRIISRVLLIIILLTKNHYQLMI